MPVQGVTTSAGQVSGQLLQYILSCLQLPWLQRDLCRQLMAETFDNFLVLGRYDDTLSLASIVSNRGFSYCSN